MGVPTDPPPPAPASAPPKKRGGPLAKENRRLVLGLVVGAIVAAFAIVNLDQVRVNWLVTETDTPLILVIAVTFALGALLGWLFGQVRHRRNG